MGKQRQTWTVHQKQAIVLSDLRGDQSTAEPARQHGVRENLIYCCKSDFLEVGSHALGGSMAPQADAVLKQENDQLKKLLGEKTLEIYMLKKWSRL